MEAEMVSEALDFCPEFMLFVTQENFLISSLHENFES
jgi:hypothetical protein